MIKFVSRISPTAISLMVISCILFFSACAPPVSKKELVVGMDLSYPPFESLDPNGSPGGISVDIARSLGAYLHRPIRIENIPFADLISALRTGKIDLVISSMTDTIERRKSIVFSDPYLTIGLACLTRKALGANEAKDLNFSDRKIAVCKGTTGQLWALKHLPRAEILILENEAEAIRAITQNKADAFIYDQMSVWKYWQLYRDQCDAILAPLTREQWAIGLRLSDKVLTSQINAFLKDFRKNGGFEKLADQYLSDQKRAFHELGIPFPFYF